MVEFSLLVVGGGGGVGCNKKYIEKFNQTDLTRGSELFSDWLQFTRACGKLFRLLLFRASISASGLLNQREGV